MFYRKPVCSCWLFFLGSYFPFKHIHSLTRASAFLATILPHKQFLSNYPLFLTNTVPAIYFPFQKNLILKKALFEKKTFPICINSSFLSNQYFKENIYSSQQTFFPMIHFFLIPPSLWTRNLVLQRAFLFWQKHFPQKLRLFWSLMNIYIHIYVYIYVYMYVWCWIFTHLAGQLERSRR